MTEPIDLWPGELRTVGGRRLHVRSGGDGGSRVVYLHGLGGSSTDWTDLMGGLAEGHHGEAPDLPGFGLSPPPDDGDYSVDAHAAAAAALIRAGDHPVHLVGNSLGGSVAVRLAADHPELVRTLTLISPALPDLRPRLVPYQMVGALVPVLGPAVYTRIQSRPAEVRVQDMLDATYFDPASAPAQRVMEALEAERERENHEHAVESVLESLRGLVAEYLRRGPRALWRQAAGVDVPTLLVYATGDRFIDPRVARRAARVFPRNRLVLLKETGHVAMMERPEAVAREVRPFLTGADASRTRPA
ncbi:alpha/beta fold hydrolase [Nocardiopsis baichengensis]|uniref:alpha/beta fold hydrolase n=1 Tax=Nocardiopsis baichengensis TaxID=280240 RepID=UPI00034D606F|nr:alpha/beta hydrolase [Nocardiopsis baichengensis]